MADASYLRFAVEDDVVVLNDREEYPLEGAQCKTIGQLLAFLERQDPFKGRRLVAYSARMRVVASSGASVSTASYVRAEAPAAVAEPPAMQLEAPEEDALPPPPVFKPESTPSASKSPAPAPPRRMESLAAPAQTHSRSSAPGMPEVRMPYTLARSVRSDSLLHSHLF